MDQDIIKIEKINKYFNENLVLNDVSLKIKKSNVVVICGPSRCGKSTLFFIIIIKKILKLFYLLQKMKWVV